VTARDIARELLRSPLRRCPGCGAAVVEARVPDDDGYAVVPTTSAVLSRWPDGGWVLACRCGLEWGDGDPSRHEPSLLARILDRLDEVGDDRWLAERLRALVEAVAAEDDDDADSRAPTGLAEPGRGPWS